MSSRRDDGHAPGSAPDQTARTSPRRLAAGALSGVVMVTCACTAAEPEIVGTPYQAPRGTLRSDDAEPTVGWVDVGRRFHVTTWGSSSCPLAPTALTVDDDELHVAMAGTGGPDCTADVRANSYAIDLPEQLRDADRLTVVLDLGDGGLFERPLERGA